MLLLTFVLCLCSTSTQIITSYSNIFKKIGKGKTKIQCTKRRTNENKTLRRSKWVKENDERKETEEELISLNHKAWLLLNKLIDEPKGYIRWKEYAKVVGIRIPNQEDYKQDSEEELRYDSEEWYKPDYNPKYEIHSTKQKLQTTEQIVKDLISNIIKPAERYIKQFYNQDKVMNKKDQDTLL